jgi:glycosyltransferase involved in cell wall biosynthesis
LKPLVSILIPAFNAQEWVADAIRSAMAQDWPRKEIIVVDDGSTDDTFAVLRRFESRLVRVTTQENQGAAAARNKAYSLCQGDYIQWLDADDLLDPAKISRQMAVVNQSRGSRFLLSGAWGIFFYRHHRARFVPTALWCDLSPTDWLLRKMACNLHMQPATWLVSRELTEEAGPWDTSLLVDDDGEYFCRVLLASEGVRFVQDAKIYYRDSGPSGLSHIGRSDGKREAQLRSMRLHISYLRSLEDSPRVRAACLQYLQTWLVYFHPERPDLVRQANEMARELGGTLELPRSSWKYSCLQSLLGAPLALNVQHFLPRLRYSVLKSCDKVLSRLDPRVVANQAEM